MAKYRKKPVVINAIQFDGSMQSAKAIREAFGENVHWYLHDDAGNFTLYCQTLEGPLEVVDDDFVIQGVKGEVYPCKPDIMEMTYEFVSE